MTRPSSDKQRAALKIAVGQLVDRIGGLESARAVLGLALSLISSYRSPAAEERHLPVDRLLDLELAAGEPIVTRFLANAHDCDLVPRGTAAALRDHVEMTDVAALIRDSGAVEANLLVAMADGRISHTEKLDLLPAIAAWRRAIDALQAKIEAA
ncbi:hypothetical protein NPA31_007305 [Aurantimonas sp. MSK8Z-1]|uniref:phage regulatory CII family protein n=1 Tax=Mangrovibrevibacter kandeliae TaxID=2968473 RepID=UPI0021185B98|nr:phage regulatory CII family protein [Aurantimonas sp. MSK8Z-1]MCW4114769.1 hypothetical protein [Aurantimonas sp. MSK8Z-1]